MSYKNKTVISSSDMQTHDLCVLSLYMYTSIIISMMMLLPAVMVLHETTSLCYYPSHWNDTTCSHCVNLLHVYSLPTIFVMKIMQWKAYLAFLFI